MINYWVQKVLTGKGQWWSIIVITVVYSRQSYSWKKGWKSCTDAACRNSETLMLRHPVKQVEVIYLVKTNLITSRLIRPITSLSVCTLGAVNAAYIRYGHRHLRQVPSDGWMIAEVTNTSFGSKPFWYRREFYPNPRHGQILSSFTAFHTKEKSFRLHA